MIQWLFLALSDCPKITATSSRVTAITNGKTFLTVYFTNTLNSMDRNTPADGFSSLTNGSAESRNHSDEAGSSANVDVGSVCRANTLEENMDGDPSSSRLTMDVDHTSNSDEELDAVDSVEAGSPRAANNLKEKMEGNSGRCVLRTMSEKESMDVEESENGSEEVGSIDGGITHRSNNLKKRDGSSGSWSVRTISKQDVMDVELSCDGDKSSSLVNDDSRENETSAEFTRHITDEACGILEDSKQMDILAAFARDCRVPSSPSIECSVKNLYKIPSINPTTSHSKKVKHHTENPNHSAATKDSFSTWGISESKHEQSESSPAVPFVAEDATVTRLVILGSEKNCGISEIVTRAIERAQDGFPDAAVEVVVHLVNINNISLGTVTSECHIIIRALNPGHEMQPPPIDRTLAADLQVDYPRPLGFSVEPPVLKDMEVYDSRYNKVTAGNIICLDYGLYSHFAVYLGSGFIAHYGNDGVTCEKLFEAVGSGTFLRFDDLDRVYRPKPTRDVILRAICRMRDRRFFDSASFATWCRYGRPITIADRSESTSLPFLLGLAS
ncbi:uncharacterized protein LOC121386721 [Gigantopelta aegis]|uniref:uncharacterized protein LOC121386721 n=1 Tax=Gigantopelta aegis TaxID=1735272 RepID=UPI001B88AC74|nr:uncharacterized protein LOC121386721 [Gigantopelta aegis]